MGFVVNEAINHYKPRIEKRKVQVKLPKIWPSVIGNAQWIEEVWVNYISNAIKYGGTPPSIEIGYNINDESNLTNGTTRFWIRDNGYGISTENQKLIFKSFERLNQTKIKGHGLGLSIVKRIIEKLGGTVGVESKVGEGSLFYFTLPTIQKHDISSAKPMTPNQKHKKTSLTTATTKLKILIAEDESTSSNLLRIILQKISKETFQTKTGKEAVDIFRLNPDIDLVLMDLKMPEMNGFDATKIIRSLNKDVVIIAQTAYALSGDREKAIDAGCNDYITKPIDKENLLSMIERLF